MSISKCASIRRAHRTQTTQKPLLLCKPTNWSESVRLEHLEENGYRMVVHPSYWSVTKVDCEANVLDWLSPLYYPFITYSYTAYRISFQYLISEPRYPRGMKFARSNGTKSNFFFLLPLLMKSSFFQEEDRDQQRSAKWIGGGKTRAREPHMQSSRSYPIDHCRLGGLWIAALSCSCVTSGWSFDSLIWEWA